MTRTLIILFLLAFLIAGCATSDSSFETLPEGDATRGESLFSESIKGAPACSSCHLLTDERLVGPGFAGYGDTAGTRVEEQSTEEYSYNAIVRPAGYIVEGYSNEMYTEYGSRLEAQDIADLIAFLLTQ